jgi:hypothetical protein
MEPKYAALRRAVDETAAVDAHAHNLVAAASSFPFLRCFSEADGDALAFAPHSLSFKVHLSHFHSACLYCTSCLSAPQRAGRLSPTAPLA